MIIDTKKSDGVKIDFFLGCSGFDCLSCDIHDCTDDVDCASAHGSLCEVCSKDACEQCDVSVTLRNGTCTGGWFISLFVYLVAFLLVY